MPRSAIRDNTLNALVMSVGAEEHPSDDDGEKCQVSAAGRPRARNAARLRAKIVPAVVDAEIDAVQRAPDHEGPARAVPEAAEQHGDDQLT